MRTIIIRGSSGDGDDLIRDAATASTCTIPRDYILSDSDFIFTIRLSCDDNAIILIQTVHAQRSLHHHVLYNTDKRIQLFYVHKHGRHASTQFYPAL